MDRPDFEIPPVPEYEPTSNFVIPQTPVRICDECGADGANNLPGTHMGNSKRLCPECAEEWLEQQKKLCLSCKQQERASPRSAYCQTCIDRKNERQREEQQRQWQKISGVRNKMYAWDLSTFPADDAAGKAALKAVEPWLWAHVSHHLVDGKLVKIDEENPHPDIDHDDHPIWDWFHGEHLGLNLYIWGPVGSGKSGLAWSLLKARVHLTYDHEEPDEYPAWANVVDLLDKAKAAMSAGDPASPIRELYEAGVLVLDDLGAERPTDWARDAIAALVQHRHTRDLPTVITSNYAPAALVKRLGHDDPMIGQRIVSRLVEHCIVVKLDRTDLRVAKKAA